MDTTATHIELAANILRKGKALVPDRFPQPSAEVTREWADVISCVDLPWDVWPEAIRVWSLEVVGERMVTPRELVKAARIVVSRWEVDPNRKNMLDQHRENRRELRDQQLKNGTFGLSRGHKPRSVEVPRRGMPDHVRQELVSRGYLKH